MVEAIAAAAGAAGGRVRRAVMFAGDLGAVARAALTEGAPGLARFALALFRPVQPMLAQPADDVADALGAPRRRRARVEARRRARAGAQGRRRGARLHAQPQRRHRAVPEIVEAVRALPARELILDGEAIALGTRRRAAAVPGHDAPLRPQARRRAHARRAAALACSSSTACAATATLLVDRPARERFDALGDALPAPLVVPRLITADVAAAEAFYADALARGHEGVMAKALDAPYEAGSRGASWLKIKRAHTLDLVVLAAEWGTAGGRAGCRTCTSARATRRGGFVMLGKTFKGMTDEMLAWQTRELLAREMARDGYTVHVRPELVVEIAFNDVQASPQYPGGLALRFARVKRYRPDKRADEADTIDTVRAIYAGQAAPVH